MVSYGKVKGRLTTFVADGSDQGEEPDLIPLQGTITFQLNVPRVLQSSALPTSLVIASTPFVAVLDSEGYLCTPGPTTGSTLYRGMSLIANDDPLLNPSNTSYTVSYMLRQGSLVVDLPPHTIFVPAGQEVDLASFVPPANAPTIGTAQAEAAAARAVEAANSAARVVLVITGNEQRPEGALLVIWVDFRPGPQSNPLHSLVNDIILKP